MRIKIATCHRCGCAVYPGDRYVALNIGGCVVVYHAQHQPSRVPILASH